MHHSALLLLVSGVLAAQSGIQPAKPDDLCSVEGRVVNSATGDAVRRATILLTRADVTGEAGPPTSYSTSSNAGGQFAIKDLDPGKYRLTVNRNGYVPFTYGARGPMRPGTTLSLARHQHLTELVLKLTPQAVIMGRVVDDEGEAVANARVMLQGYRYVNGRKQMVNAGGGNSTNDLGEYRVFGLAPGKYYLSVTPGFTVPGYAIDRSPNTAEEDYVATYYPGTIDASAAGQLEVAAGAQLRGIDIVLSKARMVHVKGRVIHDGSTGRQNISVLLMPRTTGGMFGPLRSQPVDPAGNFDIRVSPGAYTLIAMINDSGTSRQGRIPVDVGGISVEGLSVAIGPGVTVKGRVRAEGDSGAVDLSKIRVMLQPREPGIVMFGMSQARPEAEDGAFEIKNIPPDRYNFTVTGLPAGAYVKAVRSDQVDVLALGLDTGNGPPAAVDVVISPRAATVGGAVQNPNTGNPATGATVVLIPQEKERREQQSYYKVITSDQQGAFSLAGVAPGEYKAYAWEDLEMGAYMDPDFMKPLEGKGEKVTVKEADQVNLTLKLIPADAPAGER